MIGIYLKTSWRNVTNRSFYTVLNISGLALAIGCCTLIYLYISYQLSFDTYHKRTNLIFRVVYELHLQKTEYDKGSSVAVYDVLRAEKLKIKQAAISVNNQTFVVEISGNGNKRFKEEKTIAFTDSEWFKLFTYHWLSGSPEQLNEPNTAALTQKQAKKYFGDLDPINKIILINGQQIKIIGVIADNPYNTDLKSELYLSFLSIKNLTPKVEKGFFNDWGYLMSTNGVFVSLVTPEKKEEVEQELARLTKQHFGDGAKYNFKLLPLRDVHFDQRYGGKVQKSLLVTLAVIGLLILTIASINYINMMIAGQASRNVEIGTRKVLGASPGQLFMQLMTESLLNCITAVVIAITGVLSLLPLANRFLFDGDAVHILSYGQLALFAGIILLIITTGTGVYPALVLSRLNVFQALKNNLWNIKTGTSRKVLIVLQNVVAQTLVACTIIIVMQVEFLKNTDMGFDRKSVVMIPVGDASVSQQEQLRHDLEADPGVRSFSFCNNPPSSDSQRGATIKFDNRDWEKWPVRFAIGDSAYCRTFGLQLIAGRNIRSNAPIPEYLINETMAKLLHVKSYNDLLGKYLTPGDVKGRITGIVKDFNVRSLVEPIEPSVLLEQKDIQSNLAVKLSGGQTFNTLNTLRKQYGHIFPDQVFSYQFVDEEIVGLYKAQNLQQKLIWCASIIAIVISSIGLFGLISLITIQRTKEIGIRKVLGASVANIATMLSKELLILVILASFIASPIAWWVMDTWLKRFAFRVPVHLWIFGLAGAISVVIAIATVSSQSIKSALANPVKALKTE